MRSLGFTSDPHVQYLSQIIDEIRQGNLKIPKFQRPVVWDWDRQLDLLRSIRDGIPMGAIMVWRTNTHPVSYYENFGRIRLPKSEDASLNVYLLDGVQRLTTLISAFTRINELELGEPSYVDLDDVVFDSADLRSAYFDLVDNDFVAVIASKADASRHLHLSLLLDSVELLRFQRQLRGEHSEDQVRRCDELAKAFKEYKVPVIPIATDRVELASLTFKRINSSGVQMSEMHMLHAVTWSNSFHLMDGLEQLREKLAHLRWETLDDDILLRTIKAALELDIYKTAPEIVGKRLKEQPQVLDEIASTIELVAEFLWVQANIPTPDFVPYGMQIIGLAEFFRNRKSIPEDRKVQTSLLSWLWRTTYFESFTGMSGDKVNQHLAALRILGEDDDHAPLEKLVPVGGLVTTKRRFDFRTARSKALVIRLVQQLNKSDHEQGSSLIQGYGRQAVQFLVSKSLLSPASSLYYSPGNKILCAPFSIDGSRDYLLSGSVMEQDLFGNFLDERLLNLLADRAYDEFIGERARKIEEAEINFLLKLERTWIQ